MVKDAQQVTISGWQSDFMWPLKTFLEVTRSHPRYLECSPTSRHSNAPTLMVARHHNPFLMKQTWKNSIFKKNYVKNSISCEKMRFLFVKSLLQSAAKNSLKVPRSHLRYLECSPTSRLSNAPTLMVVRHHNPFLMKQTSKNSDFSKIGSKFLSSWSKMLKKWLFLGDRVTSCDL